MPAPSTRLARIDVAERAGGDRPGQDRIFTTRNAVIVLDGASHPDPTERDGGWLADTLGRDLRVKLSADLGADLADVLAAAIADVARRYALAPAPPHLPP